MFEKIFIGLFTGLVLLLIGHWIRIWGDDARRRRKYRLYIELLRKDIKSRNAITYFEFYRSTFEKFDREAQEVMPHIRCERVKDKLAAARREYPDLGLPYNLMDDKKNEENRQKILALLKGLLDCMN